MPLLLFVSLALAIFVFEALMTLKIFQKQKKFCKAYQIDSSRLPSPLFCIVKRLADVWISFLVCITVLPIFKQTFLWLDAYFKSQNPNPKEIPLHFAGTSFQQKVWRIIQTIPYGKVLTYSDIAKKISEKMSAQAVRNAVSRNPISIIIDCHRLIGANNSLTGYAGGIDKKKKLLELEGFSLRQKS